MGFRICYLATRMPAVEFAEALKLEVSGTTNEHPESDYWAASLTEGGWSVIWSEDETFGARSLKLISEISRKSDVIHCCVNETVMWSSSEYWSAGDIVWEVNHDGSGDDEFNLTATGKLPEAFREIRDRYIKEQKTDGDSCDYIFEIPLELARSYVGFRHEDFLTSDDVAEFYILTPRTKRGLLSRLFRA